MKRALLDVGGLQIVICGSAALTWVVRLATWAVNKPGTPRRRHLGGVAGGDPAGAAGGQASRQPA
jgi:hypothetical protein